MGPHPIALAIDVDDGRPVKQAVEDRRGDGRVLEDLAPGGDPAVGGQDRGPVFVAAG
jgi:hypothetical protein